MARVGYDHAGVDGVGSSGEVEEDNGFVSLPPAFSTFHPDWRQLNRASTSPRCWHCRNWIGHVQGNEEQHVQHVLNGCSTFENQGRYGWRHAAVLNFIYSCMDAKDFRVYADLPHATTESGGTVPESLLKVAPSSKHPDMVFFSRNFDNDNEASFDVGIVELTIPWDGRVEAARSEKQAVYSNLVQTLSSETRTPVRYISLEIGSFHQRLSEGTKSCIKELYGFTRQAVPLRTFRRQLIRMVEYCSFHIVSTKDETEWAPLQDYPDLPAAMMDDEKDNVSSESEPIDCQTTDQLPEVEAEEDPPDPTPAITPFAPRMKLSIYVVLTVLAAYLLYNYWHVILLTILCFLAYKVWSKVVRK